MMPGRLARYPTTSARIVSKVAGRQGEAGEAEAAEGDQPAPASRARCPSPAAAQRVQRTVPRCVPRSGYWPLLNREALMPIRQPTWALAALLLSWLAAAASAADRGPDSFAGAAALIKPAEGESRWRQVPWLTSVWEARQKAAAEGKPIFVWAGSGGGPAGVC
jgi:hypothetical protein